MYKKGRNSKGEVIYKPFCYKCEYALHRERHIQYERSEAGIARCANYRSRNLNVVRAKALARYYRNKLK